MYIFHNARTINWNDISLSGNDLSRSGKDISQSGNDISLTGNDILPRNKTIALTIYRLIYRLR